MAVVRTLKKVMRSSGISDPLKKWLLSNVNTGFYSLSPDLLVALVRVFETGKNHEGGAYYEFGLFRGFSIWFAEQISRGKVPADFPFYGFDSFQGLPHTTVDSKYYSRGEYSAGYDLVMNNLEEFGGDLGRIKLFAGYYSKALFERFSREEAFKPVSIAVIDVDLYESCVEVLEFLKPHLRVGSILVLDDYNDMDRSDDNGERKAFREFEAKTGMTKELVFELGRECAVFRVTKVPE